MVFLRDSSRSCDEDSYAFIDLLATTAMCFSRHGGLHVRLCPCTLDALRRLRSVFGSLLATPPLSMCCWGVRDWKADDCS